MVYEPNIEFGLINNHIEKWRGYFAAYNKETSPDNENGHKLHEKYRQVRVLRLLFFYLFSMIGNIMLLFMSIKPKLKTYCS